MPTTALTHRQKTGQFYGIAVQKSGKGRKQDRNRPLAQPCSMSTEVTGCCISMTATALYCLFFVLLLLSGDIELNPGPRNYGTAYNTYNDYNDYNDFNEYNYFSYFMQQVQMSLDNKFSDFMNFLQTHADDVCHKVDEKLEKLENSFSRLAADLYALQEGMQKDREDIHQIKQSQSYQQERMDRIEQELEQLQKDSRQCTLKLIGVREEEHETTQTSLQIVVDLLNEFSSSRTWHEDDIERCYRVGARRTHRDPPRPLIVRMHRWGDKMKILTDKVLRDLLRRENIRITADLTVRQREEVEHHRQQGKLAYFRAGRLQVEDPHQRPPTYSGNHQRDQQTYRHRTREELDSRHWRTAYSSPEESVPSRDRPGQREQHPASHWERSWRQSNNTHETFWMSQSRQTSGSTSFETPGPYMEEVPIAPGTRLYSEVLTGAASVSEGAAEEPGPSPSPTRRKAAEVTSVQRPSPAQEAVEQVGPQRQETVCEQRRTRPCPTVWGPAGSEPALSSAPGAGERRERGVVPEDEHALQRGRDRETTSPMAVPSLPPSNQGLTPTAVPSLPPSTQGLLFGPHPSPTSSRDSNKGGEVHAMELSAGAPLGAGQQSGDSPDRPQQSSPPVLNIGGRQSSGACNLSDNNSQQTFTDRQTRRTQARLPTTWMSANHCKNKNKKQASKPRVSKKKK